jgi:hypothetical protein
MTRDELLNLSDEEFIKRCHIDFYKASGPGGQKKNKTESAVRLTLRDSTITASASEERQQSVNRSRAISRLRMQVAFELRETAKVWEGQWDMNQKNPKYPQFIACLIDHLVKHSWKVSDAATNLSISTGKLIKILAKNDTLWQLVNQSRIKAGHKPLKKE